MKPEKIPQISGLPLFVHGIVTRGFGRGSKELGIPTANYSQEIVNNLPTDLETGVYSGWAQVNNGPVQKMVMSVGWNLFYNNKEKTMEIHIMHKFDEDFYGSEMKVCILSYMRPMRDFGSVEELITAIQNDIDLADKHLNEVNCLKYKKHQFFNP